jgi:hypothetical protein
MRRGRGAQAGGTDVIVVSALVAREKLVMTTTAETESADIAEAVIGKGTTTATTGDTATAHETEMNARRIPRRTWMKGAMGVMGGTKQIRGSTTGIAGAMSGATATAAIIVKSALGTLRVNAGGIMNVVETETTTSPDDPNLGRVKLGEMLTVVRIGTITIVGANLQLHLP